MLHFNTTTAPSYAQTKNERFKDKTSNILSIQDRWDSTYNSLPTARKTVVDQCLAYSLDEFRRRNPHLTTWEDLQAQLPDTKWVPMNVNFIDATMQRQLKQLWSIEIVNGFQPHVVAPIQVYRPIQDQEVYVAWDGQHTLIALWLIATQIFGRDPSTVTVPVNGYRSNQKALMRDGFIGRNGGIYVEALDQFDKIEQMIFGARIDLSDNPKWHVIERKQTIVESHDLFLTKREMGDAHMPGAVSRMQEFMSLTEQSLAHLCDYLVAVGCQNRPAEEKELVMMAYFFDRCRAEEVPVSTQLILDVARVTKQHWNADFAPMSDFWARCSCAYYAWHKQHVTGVLPRFNKEPTHGYPFLIEQFKKDLPQHKFPTSSTGSNFVPTLEDLYT